MKKVLFIAATATLVGATFVAQADTAKKQVTDWTCEDFLTVDTVSQPSVIAYAQALNSKGQPDEGIYDVAVANKVSQMTAAECKVEPKASFMNKLRSVWEKQGK